jgi:hypothetical protein
LIVVFVASKDAKMRNDLQNKGERIILGERPPQKKQNEAAVGP